MKSYFKHGFTLIELLVVISIIVILSGLVILNVSKSRIKGRDAKRMADLRSIQTALELYFDANKGYPVDYQAGTGNIVAESVKDAQIDPATNNWIFASTKSGTAGSYVVTKDYNWSKTYLLGLQPRDPVGGNFYPYESGAAEGDATSYSYWSDGLRYVLAARFEDINNPEINGSKIIDPETGNLYSAKGTNGLGKDCFVLTN